MTRPTRGRAQATGRAGGARHSQQRFLPVVFLEWALPVLSAARDPRLPGSGDFLRGIGRPPSWLERGGALPRSHTNSSPPLARKASGQAPFPPKPKFPALMSQNPAHQCTNTSLASPQSSHPPRKAWPQRTGGLAVAPKARSLGWSRPFTRTLVTRQSWKAPPASLHGCSPLLSQAGPAPTHRGSRSPAQSLLRAGIEIL